MKKWGKVGGVVLLISSLLLPLQLQVAGAENTERENFSYINMVDPNKSANYGKHLRTEAKNSKIDVVSPNFYKINNDEEETLNRVALRTELVEDMHGLNIKVVPRIYNDWNNHLTLKNIDTYVNQLASDVEEYQFDGIHIDLENINPEYKERLTEFVKKLRNRLSQEKQVSVAVAAVPAGQPEGWQVAYEYKKIAEALTGPNDYIVIMAYDEYGTNKGPVARDSFVEKSIDYAVNKLKISNKKIVLGIPLYGLIARQSGDQTSQTMQLEHWRILGDPNNHDFVPVLKKFKDKITITREESTPVATFTLEVDSDYKIKDNFPMKAGTYTVWYDDEYSIKKKLSLVQKYDLRGAASWSLAQEYTPMWDYYNDWLNGKYVSFKDLDNRHWAKDTIETMASFGIITGFADQTFRPENHVTRAQFATLIIKTLGITGTASEPFTDVKPDDWYYHAVALAYKYKIINGKSNTIFAPNDTITRQEMATMMVRAMKVKQTVQAKDVNGTLKIFKDRNQIADWAKENVAIAVEQGLINGMGDGTFAPANRATRAQAAVIMDRLYQKLIL